MLGYDLVFTFESKVAQDQQALTLQEAKRNTTQSLDQSNHHHPMRAELTKQSVCSLL